MEEMQLYRRKVHGASHDNNLTHSLLALLPDSWPKNVPLVRMYTCGCIPVVIELLQGFEQDGNWQPIYAPPSQATWKAYASKTTLTLLAYLVSQPGCYALQDTLAQALRPGRQGSEDLEDRFLRRPENVVSHLRHLLYPPVLQQLPPHAQRTVRNTLIRRTTSSQDSGPGYQLALSPFIWLDVDVMEAAVKQAETLERFGESGRSEWEKASHIGLQGVFLPHELYSDWTMWRRRRVRELLWRSVEAQLKALNQEHGGEDTSRLLTAYWQADMTNEDAFRLLAESLAKREQFQQAEDLYQHLCLALEHEGKEPHERTHEVMAFVRARGISRQQDPVVYPSFQAEAGLFSTPNVLSSATDDLSPLFSFAVQTDASLFERYSVTLCKPTLYEGDLAFFEQQTRLYWRAREETSISTVSLYAAVLRHLDDLHLLFGRSHLPLIRQSLCGIVSRTMLLAGMLLYDQGLYAKARTTYRLAYQAAVEANALPLQAIIWGWMSFTWTYEQSYRKALSTIHSARSLANQADEPLLRAWLGAIEAEIQAHLLNSEGCLQALQDMELADESSPKQETGYLFEFNPTLFLGYRGVCLQQLYRRGDSRTTPLLRDAREALQLALTHHVPLKRRIYYMTDLASVYARQGDLETACSYLSQSIPLLKQTGSGSATVHKHWLQARTLLAPHEQAFLVQEIDAQMISFCHEER